MTRERVPARRRAIIGGARVAAGDNRAAETHGGSGRQHVLSAASSRQVQHVTCAHHGLDYVRPGGVKRAVQRHLGRPVQPRLTSGCPTGPDKVADVKQVPVPACQLAGRVSRDWTVRLQRVSRTSRRHVTAPRMRHRRSLWAASGSCPCYVNSEDIPSRGRLDVIERQQNGQMTNVTSRVT